MDSPAPDDAELRERAVSSEPPCSTRANPFDGDDGNIHSRKRRRTSLHTASRSRSVESSVSSSASEQRTSADDASLETDSATMKDETEPVTPQTPEPKAATTQATPRSSRVTINVRTPSRPLETMASSPQVSEQERDQGPASDMLPDKEVRTLVEEKEVDMTNASPLDPNPAMSRSGTSSPAVEVIEIEDNDDPNHVSEDLQFTVLQEELHDPTDDFPFREVGEPPVDTLGRLMNYMSNHETVAKSLSDWLEKYLAFVKQCEFYRAWDSYRRNRQLWHTVPDLITHVVSRRNRPSYPRSPMIRREIFRFYRLFAELTAFFLTFDIRTIRETVETDDSCVPELVSPGYIHSLGVLSRPSEISFQQTQQGQNSEPDLRYSSEIKQVLRAFQMFHPNQGGSMAYLSKLGLLHGELVGKFPKLCDNMGYITLLMANLTRESAEVCRLEARYTLEEVQQCKSNMARAYHYFEAMSATLATVIDNHVNYLSPDSASTQLQALTDMYFDCLSMDRIVPAPVVLEHRRTHLPIADADVPDALAYYWKFTMFTKLIMSKQMQLRVTAASNMCTDLVSFWKRHNQLSSDSWNFLKYLADFLLRTGLVSYILGPTCHPEITVESSNIVGFLLVSETYTNKHTDLMWQTIISTQDPRVSEALIRMTHRIANLFPPEHMIYLCEKMDSLPVEAFSPPIRELCAQVFGELKTKVTDRPLDIPPYRLCVRLARQASVFGSRSRVAYPDLYEFATSHFKDLLANGPDHDGRRVIFIECLRDIGSKSPTSLGSLAILVQMFTMRPLQREMQVLGRENDLARLLVDEMEWATAAARGSSFPAVISYGYNFPRKEMIAFIVHSDTMSITTELGHRLWALLVGSGAACREDRDVGWQILNQRLSQAQGANPTTNAFISACFEEYLPTLPPEYFCAGTLEFVRAIILPQVADADSIVLDDYASNGHGAIEQLWRIVLAAPSPTLASQATQTLVSGIYVESKSVLSLPPYRACKVHLAVADRCLSQLAASASKLRQFSNGIASSTATESMVVAADEKEVREQELLFVRSLDVLRALYHRHQGSTHFTVPDLSALILNSPTDVEGESADLKFQAFDGDKETDVGLLAMGRQNTVGSLLAALREATGFSNYRVFYRGQPFLPHPSDVSKTLEKMHIVNGIMLVKRNPEPPMTPSPKSVRLGSTPLENKILAHFEDLSAYLGLEERLAREMYNFMVTLPADDKILRAIETADVPYTELLPAGQPFKILYAIHALQECLTRHRDAHLEGRRAGGSGDISMVFGRVMSLIVAGLIDENVLGQCSSDDLRVLVGTELFRCFIDVLKDTVLPGSALGLLDARFLDRLVSVFCSAKAPMDQQTEHTCLCLEAIFDSCSRSEVFWSAFKTNEMAIFLVRRALLKDSRLVVRQHTKGLICGMVTAPDQPGMLTAAEFASFFWPFALDMIEVAMAHAPGAPELFGICLTMLERLLGTEVDAAELFATLSEHLLAYTTYEDMTQPDVVDGAASGLIGLMQYIVHATDSPLNQPQFPKRAFWKLLFPPFDTERSPSPHSSEDSALALPRPILSKVSRQKLMDIVLRLVMDSPGQVRDLVHDLGELVPYYGDDGEPYAYELTPQFERSKQVRAPCGYAGLRNLSNTCYFNSLLTQLFMNVRFRSFMMNVQVEGPQDARLLFQTQKLFAFMQESLRRFVDPEDCVGLIKTYEDSQIDIHVQMDVEEFYNLLFDRWEGQLKDLQDKKQFRSFYGGQLVQQVQSQECEHVSETFEPFSAIQCDIKGKACLEESLQAYVDGEIMEGDNKYKCSTCDKHVNAVKRACLKEIPDNLIFHLKRFDFNLRTLQRSKINDHFTFPPQIDMRPYTIQHLSNPDQDNGEDMFVLVGVILHSGTADSGHYYSYILERPRRGESDRWVEFNDETVSPWDPANMENACFGGVDLRTPYDNTGLYDKSWSAYMLFYQRASSLRKEQEAAASSVNNSGNSLGPLRPPIRPGLRRYIELENISLLRRHCLYDPSHMDLVIEALNNLDRLRKSHAPSLDGSEELAMTMALGHLDQVASRARDVPDFERLLRQITGLMKATPSYAYYVYKYFHLRRQAIRSLVQRNAEASVRSASADLLLQATGQIKDHFPDRYGDAESDDDGSVVLHGMMGIFSVLFEHFHTSLRSWPEVFGFVAKYVEVGVAELATFMKYPFLRHLIWLISADPSVETTQQLNRVLVTLSRRARPPSYYKIIELLSVVFRRLDNVTDTRNLFRDERDRAHGDRAKGPYMLTNVEYRALAVQRGGSVRKGPSLFIEKLIALNQNDEDVWKVVENYMRMSRDFEDRVYLTLKDNISRLMPRYPGQLNGPFLRTAMFVFIRQAWHQGNVADLITHVTAQVNKGIENTEGQEFFDFLKFAATEYRENTGESLDDILELGLRNLPEWAPGILAYYDPAVANEMETYLDDVLFSDDWRCEGYEEATDQERIAQARLKCTRRLGKACLMHLDANYVQRRANVPVQVCERFQNVINKCKPCFDLADVEDRLTAEFRQLLNTVPDAVSRLAVDDMEEDGSGMFYSDSSSVVSSVTAG